MLSNWLPFLFYAIFAAAIPASMIAFSFLLPRRPAARTKQKMLPFESGVAQEALWTALLTAGRRPTGIDLDALVDSARTQAREVDALRLAAAAGVLGSGPKRDIRL